MSNPKPITRFAPSPNGRLHMGHAYSALLNQKLAGDGTFYCALRILTWAGGRKIY